MPQILPPPAFVSSWQPSLPVLILIRSFSFAFGFRFLLTFLHNLSPYWLALFLHGKKIFQRIELPRPEHTVLPDPVGYFIQFPQLRFTIPLSSLLTNHDQSAFA